MRSAHLLVLLLVAAAGLLELCSASLCPGQQEQVVKNGIIRDGGLLDSYLQFFKPKVSLSAKQSGRDGRTTITVKLAKDSVSPFMPTTAPQADGMTFDVLNTWDALQNIATAYRRADEINQDASPSSPPFFPKTSVAARAASIAPPAEVHPSFVPTATPSPSWFVRFPPNLLMLPFGSSTGAIADVLDVSYDDTASTPAVTMQLDVVSDPVVFSQFIPGHTSHSIDTAAAHYHFKTRPGIKVDAQGLLQNLKDSGFNTEGLHVFLKSEPLQVFFTPEFTPPNPTTTVGKTVRVTITFTGSCKKPTLMQTIPDNRAIIVTVTSGPGIITATSPPTCPSTASPTAASPCESLKHQQHHEAGVRETTGTAYTNNGEAYFDLLATAPGKIIIDVSGDIKSGISGATVTATSISTAVTKLVLLPKKAYRRCGDPITLTATALNSLGGPVAGANVTLALAGDCKPEVSTTIAVTNAAGAAFFTLNGPEHGAIAAVAAVQTDTGVVLSGSSHVIFFDSHEYLDRRERDYFRHLDEHNVVGDGDGHYGQDRDAWHYEHQAAKLAEQQALGSPLSTAN